QLPPQRRAASLGEGHNGANGRLTGAPPQPRRPIERPQAPVRNRPVANADNVSIDDAVAEIAARQRALDSEPAPRPATREAPAEIAARQRALDSDPAPQPATRDATAEIATRQRVLEAEPAPQPAPDVAAEIAATQRVVDAPPPPPPATL